MGSRLGDNAEMCLIELVDFNKLLIDTDVKSSKRRRRKRKSKTENDINTTKKTKSSVDSNPKKKNVNKKSK